MLIRRALFIVVLILLLVGVSPARSQDGGRPAWCAGTVITNPATIITTLGWPGPGEPIQKDVAKLHVLDTVRIYESWSFLETGEIWYRVDGGYIQGYGGYTIGRGTVVVDDYTCAKALLHHSEE
jgi:hypothetical protein